MKLYRISLILGGAAVALFSTARAQIIYSGAKSIAISAATFPEAAPFKIDFNNDGVFDLEFFFRGPSPQFVLVGGLLDGAYSGVVSSVPDFITVGQPIDAARTWWSPSLSGNLNFTIGPNAFGFFSGNRGFVGARFTVGADSFYGWVDYAGNSSAPTTGTVFGWAYESTPNKAIAAGAGVVSAVPEPGTYGLVAAGFAMGLCVLRRNRLR